MSSELQRLIEEQEKDAKSRHVSRDGRVTTRDPKAMDDRGLVYDPYHGWVRDDA